MYTKRIISTLSLIIYTVILLYIANSKQESIILSHNNNFFNFKSTEIGLIDITYNGVDNGVIIVTNTSNDKLNNYKYILAPSENIKISLTDGVGTYNIESYSVVRTSNNSERVNFKGDIIEYIYDCTEDEYNNIFLKSTSLVNYSDNIEIINKTFEDTNDIDEIFYFFSNFEYDTELAKNISVGNIITYNVDISKRIEERKGICLDIASSMAAVLRSKGYPTQLIYGYLKDGSYHSWIRVYINNKWETYDPTLVKSGKVYDDSNYYITEYH